MEQPKVQQLIENIITINFLNNSFQDYSNFVQSRFSKSYKQNLSKTQNTASSFNFSFQTQNSNSSQINFIQQDVQENLVKNFWFSQSAKVELQNIKDKLENCEIRAQKRRKYKFSLEDDTISQSSSIMSSKIENQKTVKGHKQLWELARQNQQRGNSNYVQNIKINLNKQKLGDLQAKPIIKKPIEEHSFGTSQSPKAQVFDKEILNSMPVKKLNNSTTIGGNLNNLDQGKFVKSDSEDSDHSNKSELKQQKQRKFGLTDESSLKNTSSIEQFKLEGEEDKKGIQKSLINPSLKLNFGNTEPEQKPQLMKIQKEEKKSQDNEQDKQKPEALPRQQQQPQLNLQSVTPDVQSKKPEGGLFANLQNQPSLQKSEVQADIKGKQQEKVSTAQPAQPTGLFANLQQPKTAQPDQQIKQSTQFAQEEQKFPQQSETPQDIDVSHQPNKRKQPVQNIFDNGQAPQQQKIDQSQNLFQKNQTQQQVTVPPVQEQLQKMNDAPALQSQDTTAKDKPLAGLFSQKGQQGLQFNSSQQPGGLFSNFNQIQQSQPQGSQIQSVFGGQAPTSGLNIQSAQFGSTSSIFDQKPSNQTKPQQISCRIIIYDA